MGQAKLKAKRIASAVRYDHYGDFIADIRAGKAYFLVDYDGRKYSQKSINAQTGVEICRDLAVPSYDFGDQWYTQDQAFMNGLSATRQNLLDTGQYRLPHKMCCVLIASKGSIVPSHIVIFEETDVGFEIHLCTKMSFNDWHYNDLNFTWDSRTSQMRRKGGRSYTAEFNEAATFIVTMALDALVVLTTRPEDNIIESTELPRNPAKRSAPTGAIEPPPCRLIRIRTTASTRFDWSRVKPVNPLSKCGSPRSPHDRRGHERVYKKTGLRIWINETKIKGGSQTPRPAVVQVLH